MPFTIEISIQTDASGEVEVRRRSAVGETASIGELACLADILALLTMHLDGANNKGFLTARQLAKLDKLALSIAGSIADSLNAKMQEK